MTVKGTKQNTVIFAGDRWSDFAWNGIGYNQWMPVTRTGARPQFHSGPSSIVTNVNGGANGSRFGLQIGASSSYAGGVRQRVTVPAGTYKLALSAKTSGSLSAAQVIVTDAAGGTRTLTIPASSGWTRRELANIPLAAGAATVTIRTASGNGFLHADALSLVRTSA
ncbi:hypothetical protein [Lentzea alba]|uniref:hypothetical protein n=1 Tax=Lentzea alba TaxID=2714351 RepID=UPI001A95173D|nr:hypothetical protein [Lentzea alba]